MPSPRKVSDEQILEALQGCASANAAAKRLGIAWAVLKRRCLKYGPVGLAIAFDCARSVGKKNRGYRAGKQPHATISGPHAE